MVNTNLKHGACAVLPAQVAAVFCSCRAPPLEPRVGDLRSSPPTLQLLDAPAVPVSSVFQPLQPAGGPAGVDLGLGLGSDPLPLDAGLQVVADPARLDQAPDDADGGGSAVLVQVEALPPLSTPQPSDHEGVRWGERRLC